MQRVQGVLFLSSIIIIIMMSTTTTLLLQPAEALLPLRMPPAKKSPIKKPEISFSSPAIQFPQFSSKDYQHWSHISNAVKENRRRGMEYALEWDPKTCSTDSVIADILQVIHPWFDHDDHDDVIAKQRRDLLCSIETFQQVCLTSLDNVATYKIKVNALWESHGTKCPAWHTDNVPMRWLQTFVGEGSNYLSPEEAATNDCILQIFERMGRNATFEWKDEMVEKSGLKVLTPKHPGEPIIFVGNRWSVSKKREMPNLMPVLHRSPNNIPKNQGRVLLTLDVTTRAEHDHDHDHHEKETSPCTKACCSK